MNYIQARFVLVSHSDDDQAQGKWKNAQRQQRPARGCKKTKNVVIPPELLHVYRKITKERVRRDPLPCEKLWKMRGNNVYIYIYTVRGRRIVLVIVLERRYVPQKVNQNGEQEQRSQVTPAESPIKGRPSSHHKFDVVHKIVDAWNIEKKKNKNASRLDLDEEELPPLPENRIFEYLSLPYTQEIATISKQARNTMMKVPPK